MSQKKLVLSTETGKNWPASVGNIIKSLRLNPSSAFNASGHWWHLHLVLFFFPLHSGVGEPLIQEVGRENITGRKTESCQILCEGKTTEKPKNIWAVGCCGEGKETQSSNANAGLSKGVITVSTERAFLIERKISIFALTIHTYTHIITTITIATTKSSSLA